MDLKIREANVTEVAGIVGLLADDPLGAGRERYESPLPDSYLQAFAAIDSDPNNELMVVLKDTELVGVMQLTFMPSITYQGGWRATIEGVRVSAQHRSQGIGREIFRWAIDRARERGCHMVQLTTDKSRPEALKFYEQLGFVASHHGMKLKLAGEQ